MSRTVEGQPAPGPGSVEGQNTGSGPEGQYGGTNATPLDARVEGQIADNDVEGQDNDARPFAVTRPYPSQSTATPGATGSGPTTRRTNF